MGQGGKCLNMDVQYLQNREVYFQILEGHECGSGDVDGQFLDSFYGRHKFHALYCCARWNRGKQMIKNQL